jgi:hypothetical protein
VEAIHTMAVSLLLLMLPEKMAWTFKEGRECVFCELIPKQLS